MKVIKLYKYIRADGGTTVSPNQPETGIEWTTMYRLVADEGKVLTNGDYTTHGIDVERLTYWDEIATPTAEVVTQE